MSLYSIEDSKGIRTYYKAIDSHEFTMLALDGICKEKKLGRREGKNQLKDYTLTKHHSNLTVPIFDIESQMHTDILVKTLLEMYNEGYIGYALMDQYYYE